MRTTQTRTALFFNRGFRILGLVTTLMLLSIPFTTAFADHDRRGGAVIFSGSEVPGWRLGGRRDSGGFQIFKRERGGWVRVRGSGIRLYGHPRNPFVLNAQNEVYRWNGYRWRFVGRENRFSLDRGFNNVPRYRRDQRRGVYRDDRYGPDHRYDRGRPGYRSDGRFNRDRDRRRDRN